MQRDERASLVLRLYVSGSTPGSALVIRTIRRFCDEHLAGRSELSVVDVQLQPQLARDVDLVALPTLILAQAGWRRAFVGRSIPLERLLAIVEEHT